jgi:hypothetical protein
MTPEEKVKAINKKPVGTAVIYWPVFHKNGKRTHIKSAAFLSKSGSPVIFLDGIVGYVHTDHVEIGSLMSADSPCFDREFQHRWE